MWGPVPAFLVSVTDTRMQISSELLPVTQNWAHPTRPLPKRQTSKRPSEVAVSRKQAKAAKQTGDGHRVPGCVRTSLGRVVFAGGVGEVHTVLGRTVISGLSRF